MKMQSRIIDILITLVFGIFGIHRLLKGNTYSFFIYLFTFGLLGIGYLIDLFCVIFRGPRIRFLRF